MSEVLIKERTVRMDALKLFKMIEDLSYSHFAKITFKANQDVSIKFYTRPGYDLVCSWIFGENFFDKELKVLFHKHNSVINMTEARKEQ